MPGSNDKINFREGGKLCRSSSESSLSDSIGWLSGFRKPDVPPLRSLNRLGQLYEA